uniref:Uncharacterized protein n=1 Tax=Arundo donax TaxID=35708 RepID=A0A0A9GMS7_ARUDO
MIQDILYSQSMKSCNSITQTTNGAIKVISTTQYHDGDKNFWADMKACMEP